VTTTLSFAPDPGAAPLGRQLLAQTRMELRLLLRNGEQLLLALVIPLLLLVGGAEAGGVVDLGPGRRIDVLTPGIMALAVMSTAFTSLAIATGFERRYGVLKRLGASPLPRHGLLLGKVLALLTVLSLQLLVIAAAGLLLGWRPGGGFGAVLECAALIVLGTAAFAGLGLFMAGVLRAEATLAAANLVYVVLLAAGAVVVPLDKYPGWWQPLATWLPSGALAEGMRDATTGGGAALLLFFVLAVWVVIEAALAVRTFRWE
jgi:ABC-2 type transport system permease protein